MDAEQEVPAGGAGQRAKALVDVAQLHVNFVVNKPDGSTLAVQKLIVIKQRDEALLDRAAFESAYDLIQTLRDQLEAEHTPKLSLAPSLFRCLMNFIGQA
jgi:hypothetical protein